MQPGESYPPKSWPITCFEDARDLREPPPDEDDVLVSVESENNSNEVCTFRAVVMHQYRTTSGDLCIDVEEGTFDQRLSLQRGVRFIHEFGKGPLSTAPQTPVMRSAAFIVDGVVEMWEDPSDGEDPWWSL